MTPPTFLPGVPTEYVLERLAKAGGREVESGKLASGESSAALAVNCFGWFAPRPALLPPFPRSAWSFPPTRVDIEFQARFPWRGGRHPWLDAVAVTETHLIGIESKRFEPFRDAKSVSLSPAYDRPEWGTRMAPFETLRDQLRSGALRFDHLDVAQLLKHAFGLVTEAGRTGKQPVLIYLFAEPKSRGHRLIGDDARERHRSEIVAFASAVHGAAVEFYAISYRKWIASWATGNPSVIRHGQALLETFAP